MKAKLHLMPPAADGLDPPSDLGASGRELWQTIMREYRIDDTVGQQILRQVCLAEDIAKAAHEAGKLKDELACRAFVARGLMRLNLDAEPVHSRDGRPAGGLPNNNRKPRYGHS